MPNGVSLDLSLPLRPSGLLLKQLHHQLREAILSGRLKAGLRLPSTRAFAARYSVSRNTAVSLYDLLVSEGLLIAKTGGGTFVAQTAISNPAPAGRTKSGAGRLRMRPMTSWPSTDAGPVRFDFRVGLPDKSRFPFDTWRRLSNRALRSLAKAPAAYLDPQGPPELRTAISSHTSFTRAVACTADDVIVTSGAQQAFDLLARVFVVAGTKIAVEDPGYPPARAAFEAAGAMVRPVPVDDQGLRVSEVPTDAEIILVTPSHQFPTGATLSLARRLALLAIARERGAIIVEDDYDSEFRFGSYPVDALQTLDRQETVFYVGTFSKCLFPALRLGFLIAPAWARKALIEAKQISDWHGPALPQLTLAAFIAEGHLARHVRRMRGIYAERRAILLDALDRHAGTLLKIIPGAAGLHVGAWSGLECTECAPDFALPAGVAVEPFARYALTPTSPPGFAFGYGQISKETIDEGIARLVGALKSNGR